jgi:hypothetical protein
MIPAAIYRLAAELLVVLLLLLGAAYYGHHAGDRSGAARVQAQWNAAREKESTAAVAASEQARSVEQRRITDLERVAHDAALQADAARADADRAVAARDGLRKQLDAILAASHRAPRDPGPAGGSAPASDALDLLSDVLGRADARAGELAAAADAARIAGSACERAYQALR